MPNREMRAAQSVDAPIAPELVRIHTLPRSTRLSRTSATVLPDASPSQEKRPAELRSTRVKKGFFRLAPRPLRLPRLLGLACLLPLQPRAHRPRLPQPCPSTSTLRNQASTALPKSATTRWTAFKLLPVSLAMASWLIPSLK